MGSFRRENNKWQAQVRLEEGPYLSENFSKKRDAELWSKDQEREIRIGDLETLQTSHKRMTVEELIVRYRDTVASKKKSAGFEKIMLNALLRKRFTSD